MKAQSAPKTRGLLGQGNLKVAGEPMAAIMAAGRRTWFLVVIVLKLNGVIARMNSVIPVTLYSSMTSGTERNEVYQPVGFFPVSFKYAPRLNMMHIQRSAKFVLSHTALLAFVIVAFAGLVLLALPIWSAPFVVTALPIAMIFALLPFSSTFVRTKPSVLAAFNNMLSHVDCLAAVTTGKICMACYRLAFAAAKSHSIMAISVLIHRKVLTAGFTNNRDPISLTKFRTFLRAKAVYASGYMLEMLPAIFASMTWMFDRQTKALKRTKLLRRAVRLKQFATNHTVPFAHLWIAHCLPITFHRTVFAVGMLWIYDFFSASRASVHNTPIITHSCECVKFKVAGGNGQLHNH